MFQQKFIYLVVVFMLCFATSINAAIKNLDSKTDLSVRADDRSGRTVRYQYRARIYRAYHFDQHDRWSINGFAVTGDEFSSSHNTLDDGEADYFHFRRLYIRRNNQMGKTEFGYIPTYKGRVSSTGLSKDGWIAGLRHVHSLSQGQFEVVVGELSNTDKPDPIGKPENLDYVELEYSSQDGKYFNYEMSLERMLESNFIRGEVRYPINPETNLAFEVIERLDNNKSKVVIGAESNLTLFNRPVELFGYYSYVSEGFGPRAELTEDFLSTGHGIAMELEGELSQSQNLDWFMKFEAYQGSTRFQLGLKLTFTNN